MSMSFGGRCVLSVSLLSTDVHCFDVEGYAHEEVRRVSTGKQGQSGLGLETQQAAIGAYLNGDHWSVSLWRLSQVRK